MPSDLHETLIRLFRDAPEFTAALLQDQPGFGFEDIDKAILVSVNASVLKYAERRVDGVIELLNKAGDRMGVALEVQLDKKENKLFSWPTYLARLREDLKYCWSSAGRTPWPAGPPTPSSWARVRW